ncbi:hypothetical protein LB452_11870 [Psychroflexus sp. CAK8W]|uniref:Uncharacterized protein n=1 Tax=Psychroflexus longus TaxID=2873596 RepID=A0ABS7XMB6_9FLAO|nr:hypothetical protein [Psychroflexus longus]MBZ9779619.1 hypothetical protein [Psychroflexus longus]
MDFFLPYWAYKLILYTLVGIFFSVLAYILINKKLKLTEKLFLIILCAMLPFFGPLISIYYVKDFELIDLLKLNNKTP